MQLTLHASLTGAKVGRSAVSDRPFLSLTLSPLAQPDLPPLHWTAALVNPYARGAIVNTLEALGIDPPVETIELAATDEAALVALERHLDRIAGEVLPHRCLVDVHEHAGYGGSPPRLEVKRVRPYSEAEVPVGVPVVPSVPLEAIFRRGGPVVPPGYHAGVSPDGTLLVAREGARIMVRDDQGEFHEVPDLDLRPGEREPEFTEPQQFQFVVTVTADSYADAQGALSNRLDHEEEYGFNYELAWGRAEEDDDEAGGAVRAAVDAMDEAGTKLLARALDLRQVYGLPEGVKLVETVPLKEEP